MVAPTVPDGPHGGRQPVAPRAGGRPLPSEVAGADGRVTPGSYVPMSHRGGLPGPRPGAVDGGVVAALVTVLAPVAFVVALLAVPAGTPRNVLLLVGWLVIAVVVEQVDRRRRGRRRSARAGRPAATDRLAVVGADPASRPLEGALDP